jgi:riboflavin kinase/FMN adenylyltransferase
MGVFDGVHRGHQRVLAALEAAPAGTRVALTFGTHPAQVLSASGAPAQLTTLKERIALLAEAGVDAVAILDFDDDMVAKTAAEFIEEVLVAGLDARFVAVGEGFRFGHDAAGTTDTLAEAGQANGFTVAVVPILTDGGTEVRSTAIREAVAEGEMEEAARLLGRPYDLTGTVVPGDGRGKTIGVPTANVSFPGQLAVPKRGVYAVFAQVDGVRLPAVANLGVRPTFGGDTEVLEVHVIGADLDLEGREIGVDFVTRLRDERRFDGIDSLVKQIRQDIAEASRVLDGFEQTP